MMAKIEPPDLIATLPTVRGTLEAGAALAPLTWLRVGGPAEVLFRPADPDDLAQFLRDLDPHVSVTIIGVGSNLLVRDGGVAGVVIRLGAAFGAIKTEPDARLRVGAAALDQQVAKAAAMAGIAGLEFLRGVPGTIGGALAMNAGAYGREIGDILIEATLINRAGEVVCLARGDLSMAYRHGGLPDGAIVVEALLQGRPDDPAAITARMDEVQNKREATQPIRTKTGGSTFANPPGAKAWELIDAAGCRGLVMGDAQVSEQHCNFLINRGGASARDLEALGEEVRARVKAHAGVTLAWEIRRIGKGGAR